MCATMRCGPGAPFYDIWQNQSHLCKSIILIQMQSGSFRQDEVTLFWTYTRMLCMMPSLSGCGCSRTQGENIIVLSRKTLH